MERTTKLRITKTRKRTIHMSVSAKRVFCHNCNREVQALTTQQAAELLETSQPQLADRIVADKLHAILNMSGTLCICKDSLMHEVTQGTEIERSPAYLEGECK